ncbi:hypothetical protein OPV22_000514 [Ensete ventricosum]|uniref:Uncharacterized protein n=1 Tax=Ensete ventricosum TaxID=4639 RepID=A0AAV8QAZ0_ENSVE|nr:hypothetical protein OPV22_000514 [Ensete ventricosum]
MVSNVTSSWLSCTDGNPVTTNRQVQCLQGYLPLFVVAERCISMFAAAVDRQEAGPAIDKKCGRRPLQSSYYQTQTSIDVAGFRPSISSVRS